MRKIAYGFFVILILAAAIYAASNLTSLRLVSDNQYGFQFFMGNDPLAVNSDGVGTLQMFVFASAPYPQVYFTATLNGETLAEGYGVGHDNVVELTVPINGADYEVSIGKYTIEGTAKVANNPPIYNTAELYIIDATQTQPKPTTFTEPQATPAPLAQLTVKVYNNPTGDSFNLVSVFDSDNHKVSLSQTTLSDNTQYYYAKISVTDKQTYTVQVECAGYITQTQTVTVNGESTAIFNMEALSNPADDQDGEGVAIGEMPTGELNDHVNNYHKEKSVWDWIVYIFTFQWL